MPMAELIGWGEYAAIEPFGAHYDDLRAGIVAASVYNVNRDTEKAPEPYGPLDFTPWNAMQQDLQEPQPVDPETLSKLLDKSLFNVR